MNSFLKPTLQKFSVRAILGLILGVLLIGYTAFWAFHYAQDIFAASHGAAGELGNVSGYAWSSTVGWTNFKSHDVALTNTYFHKNPPSCPFPSAGPEPAWSMQQKGDYIFTTDYTNFFAHEITTNPAVPEFKHKISYFAAGTGGLRGFAIFGDYAFVSGGQFTYQNFYVIDISDPTSLVEVKRINDLRLRGVESVVISEDGKYAYVSSAQTGNIVVIDISTPAASIIKNVFTNPDGQRGMVISGDYLYTSGLVYFAVRNLNPFNPLGGGGDPENPPIVGEITSADPDFTELGSTYSVEIAGDYAYVANFVSHRIIAINIVDPTDPWIVDWIVDPVALTNAANITIVDGFAYVSRSAAVVSGPAVEYLTILDVADPTDIANSLVTTFVMPTWCFTPSGMSEVVVVNDYAYMANDVHGFAIKIPSRYAVSVDRTTGHFSGYAWNSGIGWISFNREVTFPPPFDEACPGGPCLAKLAFGGMNEVSGWARAIGACKNDLWDGTKCTGVGAGDLAGGWDGWIKLRGLTTGGDPYGVIWDPLTQELSGWAWGGDVVGWVSFNCDDVAGCGFDYNVKVFIPPPPNSPPTPINLGTAIGDYCFAPSSPVTVSWDFTDPDIVWGDFQTAFQVQLDDDPLFGSINVDSGNVVSGSTTYTPILEYNKAYYWRVKVWDSSDAPSAWVEPAPPLPITTRTHGTPVPSFTVSPSRPAVDEIVAFTDNSTCFSVPGNVAFLCKAVAPPYVPTYAWDFEGDAIVDSTVRGDVTHVYSAASTVSPSLQITDDLGGSCESSTSFTVTIPFADWREISPL